MSKPITNPYLKKKKPSSSSSSAPSQHRAPISTAATDRNFHPLPAATRATAIHAATFSQAFSSLEDTPQYQEQIREVSRSVGSPAGVVVAAVDPQHEQERAAQRAHDRREAESAVGDRDHHIQLQPHVLYASTKQRGNGVLEYIKNVPVGYSKMVPDFIMSTTSCALFLSIKYHQLYPRYIHRRLGELRTDFKLRVLLVLVDVQDNANVILYLNKLAVTNNLTLILAWTEQEAARYLETYKALDGKDASSIRKRESNNFQDQIVDALTACKPVNKTDSVNLLNHFSTITAVAAASQDELALCEGLGPVKVKQLFEAFHKPFSKRRSLERRKQRAMGAATETKDGETTEAFKPTEGTAAAAASNSNNTNGVETNEMPPSKKIKMETIVEEDSDEDEGGDVDV